MKKYFFQSIFPLAVLALLLAHAPIAQAQTTYTSSQVAEHEIENSVCGNDTAGASGTMVLDTGGGAYTTPDNVPKPPGYWNNPTHFCFESGEQYTENLRDTIGYGRWFQYPNAYVQNSSDPACRTSSSSPSVTCAHYSFSIGSCKATGSWSDLADNNLQQAVCTGTLIDALHDTDIGGPQALNDPTWAPNQQASDASAGGIYQSDPNPSETSVAANPSNYCYEVHYFTPNCTGNETCDTNETAYWYSGNGTRSTTPSDYGTSGSKEYFGATTFSCSNAAPIASLSAKPTTIQSGQSSTLSYSCANSSSGSILPTVGYIYADGSVHTASVSPTTNTTYTLTCNGTNGGTATASATVSVSATCVASYGQPCTSANSCGQTNTGTIECNGFCSASAPSNSTCPAATASVTIPACPSGPDLTAGSITPTNAVVGTLTTLSAPVNNIGSTTTSGSFPDLFEINPTSIPTSFASVQTTRTAATATLAGGANATASASYTFNTLGTWYVRACANMDTSGNVPPASGGVAESNYGNNCGAWTPIIVATASGPGCVLSASGANANLTLSWTASSTASSASIDQGVGSVSPVLSGSKVITYPVANTTYTMTVQDSSGHSGTCSAPIVTGGPSCTTGCGSCSTSCCGSTCGGGPSISCTRSPADASFSGPTSITFTAAPSGGALPPYTFTDALGTVLQSSSALTFTRTFSSSNAISVAAANAAGPYACGTSFTIGGSGCSGTPAPTISATPNRVAAGTQVALNWGASGVQSSCDITGTDGFSRNVTASPTCSIPDAGANPTINRQTTYCIVCDGNQATKQCATVNVTGVIKTF